LYGLFKKPEYLVILSLVMFSFIYTLYPNLDIYNDMRMLKWNLTDSGI